METISETLDALYKELEVLNIGPRYSDDEDMIVFALHFLTANAEDVFDEVEEEDEE